MGYQNRKRTNICHDQRGLASVVVTVFLMIILSLVILAFSQISRREQRQALDRQLSSQAFYAAESGINTMVDEIRKNPKAEPISKDTCETEAIAESNKLDVPGTTSYSCVLFDKAPKSLEWGSVSTDESTVVSLHTTTNNLSSLTVAWKDTDGGSTFDGCATTADASTPKLPKSGDYTSAGCDAGMLRLYFMPISGDATTESLVNSSYTVYLMPVRDGGSTSNVTAFRQYSDGPDNQGNIIPAHCSGEECTATITGLPGVGPLFLQMKSIYKANSVTLTGVAGDASAVHFDEAQVVIDSTGRASDVLRRLQVRVPMYEQYKIPAYAVESMNGVCKRLGVVPETVRVNENTSTYPECRTD